MEKRWPQEFDFVAVTVKQVDYYGYIDQIEYDMRNPRVKVEFYPGFIMWFDMEEIRFVEFPAENKR